MATITWVIFKHHKKTDGTYNPKIRISHNGTSSYMPTQIFTDLVKFKKGAASGTITSGKIIDTLNDTVKEYRDVLNSNQDVVNTCTNAKELVSLIVRKLTQHDNIDFIAFARKDINSIKNLGTQSVRTTGINALCHYLKETTGTESLNIKKLTSKFLRDYDKWLRNERVIEFNGIKSIRKPLNNTGVRVYMSAIQTEFNNALREFNDYEMGDVVITNNPFKAYILPNIEVAKKRAVPAEIIRKIATYEPIGGNKKTEIVIRDLFMLSFYFAGMNSADMWDCAPIVDGRLEYSRKKTRERRRDNAFTSIKVIDEAKELIERYKDRKGERLLDFYNKYPKEKNFGSFQTRGMQILSTNLGLDPIQFYAARHSFATIARNDCGISKDDIALCLNHSSGNTITDTYIKKDFTRIDEVIRKVVDYVFNI